MIFLFVTSGMEYVPAIRHPEQPCSLTFLAFSSLWSLPWSKDMHCTVHCSEVFQSTFSCPLSVRCGYGVNWLSIVQNMSPVYRPLPFSYHSPSKIFYQFFFPFPFRIECFSVRITRFTTIRHPHHFTSCFFSFSFLPFVFQHENDSLSTIHHPQDFTFFLSAIHHPQDFTFFPFSAIHHPQDFTIFFFCHPSSTRFPFFPFSAIHHPQDFTIFSSAIHHPQDFTIFFFCHPSSPRFHYFFPLCHPSSTRFHYFCFPFWLCFLMRMTHFPPSIIHKTSQGISFLNEWECWHENDSLSTIRDPQQFTSLQTPAKQLLFAIHMNSPICFCVIVCFSTARTRTSRSPIVTWTLPAPAAPSPASPLGHPLLPWQHTTFCLSCSNCMWFFQLTYPATVAAPVVLTRPRWKTSSVI